ncbi:MAG: hypothetical protein JXR13_15370 [Thalassovita sp.]
MAYEVHLVSAEIRDVLDGKMTLALVHEGQRAAEISYSWTDEHYTGTFHGLASAMPIPMHPIDFVHGPLKEVLKLKTDKHKFASDVFQDNLIYFGAA